MLAKKLVKVPVSAKKDAFWGNTRSLLERGVVTTLVSNFMTTRIFGVDPAELARSWAADSPDETEEAPPPDPFARPSPLSDEDNRRLYRVAQYYSVRAGARAAKSYYLDTLKGYLLGQAEADALGSDLQEEVAEQAATISFSEMAYRLGYPRFARVEDDPLRLLAELPLPIFITTSHHDFLEVALSRANPPKQPVSEIFYWDDTLHHIPSLYDKEPDYQPTPARPLVYHLYGLDSYPESLVLTEDDYLDFLIKVASPEVRHSTQQRAIPSSVLKALAGTSLLLLGYQVYDWEFRILFRGIIRAMNDSRANNSNVAESILMQIEPGQGHADPGRVKEYLIKYFDQSRFKVYWGDVTGCTRELWQLWKG
jgi:hypothetical protein